MAVERKKGRGRASGADLGMQGRWREGVYKDGERGCRGGGLDGKRWPRCHLSLLLLLLTCMGQGSSRGRGRRLPGGSDKREFGVGQARQRERARERRGVGSGVVWR